jgi:beta-phosphoglucomutase-like phosphatase (HAD superfamily)
VDFSVYSFPDVTEMMDSPPVTFGDLVTPLMVVRSGSWAQPALNGLLVASEPLLASAWREAARQADRERQARDAGMAPPVDQPLEFIAYLAERDAASSAPPAQAAGERRGERIAVEQYPLEKLQMDSEAVAAIADEGAGDPFAAGFARGAAARLLGLLGKVDHQRATFFARQSALARFDPELARVMFVQAGDESVRARLQLAEALVAAEREFLAAQSDSVFMGTFSSDYGIKMRKIIAAEYRMLEERRRLARFQNMTTAVAALALAGSVYGATVSTTASATMVAALSGVSLMGSIWAMNKSMDARSESEEVNEYFIARMAPTFERQMSVQTEWLESKEVITARGFAEFRNKTLTLYQSRVRSMSVSADERCVFRHPGFSQPGHWIGACADGAASGRGYGVVRNSTGAAVEYLGEAKAGLADGVGAMLNSPAGARGAAYFEGSFAAGLPNGVVRVEQPGEALRWREYRAGNDVGRAEATSNGDLFSTGSAAQGLQP